MIWFVILFILFFIFYRYIFFFRNPNRKIHFNDNHILSPADGFILYIKKIKPNKDNPVFSIKGNNEIKLHELMNIDNKYLNDREGFLIGIFMTPLDVHYNRSPIKGRIKKLVHDFPTGSKIKANLSMMNALSNLVFNEKPIWHDCDYLITNERASYVIQNESKSIYVTQIADKWVNKIVTFKDNEEINQGEIFGLIRMGSQVDIFIPDNGKMKINIKERQHVKAGLTCLIAENEI